MRINDTCVDLEKPIDSIEYQFTNGYTYTSLFFLPYMGMPASTMPKSFVNAYLKVAGDPLEGYVILVFNVRKSEVNTIGWRSFDKFLINSKNYSHTKILGSNLYEYTVGFYYNYSDDENYKIFSEGLYSKLSDTFKESHPKTKYENGKLVHSVIWTIFNKSENLRKLWEDQTGCLIDEDAEVWSRPNLQKETC